MKQPADIAGARMPKLTASEEPIILRKRIGSTTYTVGVHFSKTSTDTVNDKILRLVRREAERKVVGI